MNPDHKIYEHFDINLNNNNTIENKVEFSSIKSLHRQVTWDISLMLRNLQQSKYHLITLVIMTLENQENDTPNDGSNSDDVDFSDQLISYAADTNDDGTTQNVPTDGYNELDQVFKIANISNDEDGGDNDNIEVFDGGSELFFIQKSNLRLPRILNIDDDILHQNTQIILNTKTAEIMQLERNYLPKKRLAPRSFLGESVKYSSQPQSCPSFLDRNHRETKCCLFRYTLNKLQMDQNDKLRFIIFPHHLPMKHVSWKMYRTLHAN
ncbi:unnamed protein product [Heterobilharzia americana]|nr:unnamed protein product [Heterobilharzia americana]